ncbi:ankyrin-1-like [Oscarella lobularis]|uniref:ankyrin-1-like n=1 Tax=Oscarella lobularis TaxID=121494 RepID=UPI0033140D82
MLELLIRKGCDINAKNKESLFMRNFYLTYCDFQMGIGALAAASASGKIEMARKLLLMGCLVTDTDYFGCTSLHIAAKCNRPLVVNLLLDWDADIEARDKWGRTPFLHVVCAGQTESAKLLLSKGCSIHTLDKEGYGAMALACIENHYDLAELLIMHFFNEDLNDVLHLVAQRDFHRVADLLISKGVSSEARDKWGCTPLLTAIEFGSDNVIELLLVKGCNVFALTKKGESALDVALMGGRLDIFHRFVKAGIKASTLLQESREFLSKAAARGSEAAAHFLEEINIIQVSEEPLKWTSPQECH